MNRTFDTLLYVSFASLFALPINDAFAYVGPGAGLTAIGTVIALIGGVLLGIVGFIWYPIKRLLKSRRKPANKSQATMDKNQSPEAPSPEENEGP